MFKKIDEGSGRKIHKEESSQIQTELIKRIPQRPPPFVPISTILFKSGTVFKEFAPKFKASTVFLLHTLGKMGKITQMQAAMMGIGSLFIGVNLPLGVYNTYSLAKSWKKETKSEKGMKSAQILSNTLMTSAGASLLFSKVPSFSTLIGMGGSASATKVAFILGPIGMGIISILELGKGVVSIKKAVHFYEGEKIAKEKSTNNQNTPIEKALYTREEKRLSNLRRLSMICGIKSLLIGIGIGLGALVMGGVIAGALATPFGWVAVGLVGAGLAIGIGYFIVQKRIKAQKIEEEIGLIKQLADTLSERSQQTIQESLHSHLKGKTLEETVKYLRKEDVETQKKAILDQMNEEVRPLLEKSAWPENPTLLELLLIHLTFPHLIKGAEFNDAIRRAEEVFSQ